MERIKGGGAWNGGGKSGNGLRPDKSQEEGQGDGGGGRGRERSRSAESTTSQGGWHFEAAASAEGGKQR